MFKKTIETQPKNYKLCFENIIKHKPKYPLAGSRICGSLCLGRVQAPRFGLMFKNLFWLWRLPSTPRVASRVRALSGGPPETPYSSQLTEIKNNNLCNLSQIYD